MPNAQDVLWFKTEFQPKIEAQLAGTPFSVDMVTAFACQETGAIWPALRRKGLPTARILELCVGDTIDASPTGGGRRAFPKNKAELLTATGGDRMFQIARQGLVDMAEQIPDYRGAAARPDKFCHGFGIFQLDLQFFKTEPDYFLERRYADFDVALARCVGELKSALKRLGWQAKSALGDGEMAAVAIAYNTGRYDPARGLKQGYFDGSKYYGENYFDYLRLAKGVQLGAPATRGVVPTAKKARGEAEAGGEEACCEEARYQEDRDEEDREDRRRLAVKKVAGKRPVAAKKSSAKKAPAKKVAAKKVAVKKVAANKRGAKAAAKRPASRKPPRPASKRR